MVFLQVAMNIQSPDKPCHHFFCSLVCSMAELNVDQHLDNDFGDLCCNYFDLAKVGMIPMLLAIKSRTTAPLHRTHESRYVNAYLNSGAEARGGVAAPNGWVDELDADVSQIGGPLNSPIDDLKRTIWGWLGGPLFWKTATWVVESVEDDQNNWCKPKFEAFSPYPNDDWPLWLPRN